MEKCLSFLLNQVIISQPSVPILAEFNTVVTPHLPMEGKLLHCCKKCFDCRVDVHGKENSGLLEKVKVIIEKAPVHVLTCHSPSL